MHNINFKYWRTWSWLNVAFFTAISLLLPKFVLLASAGNNAGAAFSVWPDTGQIKCYDNSTEIICPPPGKPFYGQDAQYQGPQRSYTKLGYINDELVELPDTATVADGWIMTRDNVTGLIWEVKTNKDDIENYGDPHDADNIYTWCDTNLDTNGGGEGTCGNGNDTKDFINALNQQHFGGFSDWRLPTIKELSTLVNASIPYPGPSIDAAYFPNTGLFYYWSSTTVAGSTNEAWSVLFSFGPILGLDKDSVLYVRAVRSGGTGSSDHLVDKYNGTISDTNTGLMWQKCSMGHTYNSHTNGCDGTPTKATWQDALSYCESLTLAGHSDWRLPDRNELQSIVDYSKYDPETDLIFSPNTMSSSYWSSTTRADYTVFAWSVDFGDIVSSADKNTTYYVRCVRSGQTGAFEDLTIFSKGGGAVTTSDKTCQGTSCAWPFPHGTSVTLTASPANGFDFASWAGDCQGCGGSTSCTITMDTHKACTATFEGGLLGDVNGDGDVTILDALFIARHSVGLPVSPFIEELADVDCKNGITIVDALLVARKSVQLPVPQWCGQ